MNRNLWLIIALAASLVVGCMPGPQDEPTPIDVPTAANAEPDRPSMRGPRRVTLYFLVEGRLHPVQRPVSDTSRGHRLELLLAGPTATEAASGVRTAVAPGGVSHVTSDGPDTAVVEAAPGFARISGADQLLAVAQVVWTLTEHPGTSLVSVTVDDIPLEVPTDRGLSTVPVGRGDYISVQPLEQPSRSPSVPTTPSPSTSSGRRSVPPRSLPRPGRLARTRAG